MGNTAGVWLEPPLVGAEHTRVVAGLLGRFSQDPAAGGWRLRDGGLVVLSGLPGVGKSRIVREVYRGLRAGQSQPGYWPALAPTGGARITHDQTGDQAGGASALRFRKNLGPDARGMYWPPSAVPDYLWWHLTCEQRVNEQYLETRAVFADQLLCHREPATYGWARARGPKRWKDRAGELLKNSGRVLGNEAASEAADWMAADIVGQAVPFSGLVLKTLQGLRNTAVGTAGKQIRMREATLLGELTGGLSEPTDALVAVINSLALPGFPIVIAVEDIHLADPGLLDLIRRLIAPSYRDRVLVLATIWPDSDRRIGSEPIGRWLEQIGGLTINISDLTPAAVAELVRLQYPSTADDQVAAVAARWSNPLAVNLSLDLLAHDGFIVDGAVTADDTAISETPTDLAQLYDEHFKILPKDVRQAFILDVICGADPTTARSLYDPPGRAATWVPVRTDIIKAAALSMSEELDPIAQNRAVEAGWLTMAEPGWVQPREPALAAAGWRAMNREGLRRHAPAIRASATRILAEMVNTAAQQPDGSPGLYLKSDRWWVDEATWMLQLAPFPTIDDREVADAAARAALELFHALAKIRPQDALHDYSQWSPRWETILGPDHPDTLSTRNNVAWTYRAAGNPARAATLFEQVVTDVVRLLGPDHPNTLRSRCNLAGAYEDAGDSDRAIALFQQVFADRLRVLGPDHPDTLSTPTRLAGAYAAIGDWERAVPLYEQTLTDQLRVLGPEHPHTLSTLDGLAGAYLSAGDHDRAIPLYEQTLTDQLRVLGPEHPHTLTTRSNLAGAYHNVGDLERAIPLFEQTLTDQLRVLGPEHPLTLTTRSHLATAYRDAGDLEQAIPLYKQTLTDQLRVLGPQHPNTLNTRGNLAQAHFHHGNPERAIPLCEENLTKRAQVLGPDHPTTLTTRHNLATVHHDSGNLSRAIPLYEQTLEARVRVLGPDHPETLTTRSHLASANRDAGDLERAIPLYEQTLEARVRVLGPDHPETLTTRNNLAATHTVAGDLQRAVPLLEQNLRSQVRALGASHPDTKRTRHLIMAAKVLVGIPAADVDLVNYWLETQTWSESFYVLDATEARLRDRPATEELARLSAAGDADAALHQRILVAAEHHDLRTLLGCVANPDESLQHALGRMDAGEATAALELLSLNPTAADHPHGIAIRLVALAELQAPVLQPKLGEVQVAGMTELVRQSLILLRDLLESQTARDATAQVLELLGGD